MADIGSAKLKVEIERAEFMVISKNEYERDLDAAWDEGYKDGMKEAKKVAK